MRDIVWGRADTVVWLDYRLAVIMGQLVRRTWRRIVTREALWSGNRESLRQTLFSRESILLWALQTYRRRRREYPILFDRRPKLMRYPIIAGNWKMHLGRVDEALAFVRRIRYGLNQIEGVDRVLCPPFTVLASVAEVIRPTRIGLGAQTMHWEEQGAHTGEISPAMLAELCQYVILGHSERRAANNESDESVNHKVSAALVCDLTPIICVGENLAQNEAGQTHEFVGAQVRAALAGLTMEQAQQCVIAYEPLWAIGSGKAATPADANRVIGLTIRGAVADTFGESPAQAVRVLYGGSVNVENISAFMAMPEVDGALVGGASLKPDFVELVRRAALV